MFTTLDKSVRKTFKVVHGDDVKGSGIGTVDLLAQTTDGKTQQLTLTNVHFIPDQTMCLISVDKAINKSGFDSPDFKNLTWGAAGGCTLKMVESNGTYVLDASVKYWTPFENGVRTQF
jgi:hypothetical protein